MVNLSKIDITKLNRQKLSELTNKLKDYVLEARTVQRSLRVTNTNNTNEKDQAVLENLIYKYKQLKFSIEKTINAKERWANNKDLDKAREDVKKLDDVINKLSNDLNRLKSNSKDTLKNAEPKQLTNEFKQANLEAAKLKDKLAKLSGIKWFGNIAARAAAYMGLYQVFNLVTSSVRNAVGFMANLDKATRTIQAVFKTTAGEAKNLENQMLALGAAFGGSIDDINQTALELGRAGVETKNLADATKVVIQMAMLTGDTYNVATQAIVSYMTNYEKAIKVTYKGANAVEVLGNKLAKLANDSRMSTQDIGIFSNYALAVAKAAGASVDAVSAMAVALNNAGNNASTVGTLIRRFFSILDKSDEKYSAIFGAMGINQQNFMMDLRRGLDGTKEGIEISNNAFRKFLDTLQQIDEKSFARLISNLDVLDKQALQGLRNNVGNVKKEFEEFLNTSSGELSNATIIANSYTNVWERFKITLGRIANKLSGVLDAARKVGIAINSWFNSDEENKLSALGQKYNAVSEQLKIFQNLYKNSGLEIYKKKIEALKKELKSLATQMDSVNTSMTKQQAIAATQTNLNTANKFTPFDISRVIGKDYEKWINREIYQMSEGGRKNGYAEWMKQALQAAIQLKATNKEAYREFMAHIALMTTKSKYFTEALKNNAGMLKLIKNHSRLFPSLHLDVKQWNNLYKVTGQVEKNIKKIKEKTSNDHLLKLWDPNTGNMLIHTLKLTQKAHDKNYETVVKLAHQYIEHNKLIAYNILLKEVSNKKTRDGLIALLGGKTLIEQQVAAQGKLLALQIELNKAKSTGQKESIQKEINVLRSYINTLNDLGKVKNALVTTGKAQQTYMNVQSKPSKFQEIMTGLKERKQQYLASYSNPTIVSAKVAELNGKITKSQFERVKAAAQEVAELKKAKDLLNAHKNIVTDINSKIAQLNGAVDKDPVVVMLDKKIAAYKKIMNELRSYGNAEDNKQADKLQKIIDELKGLETSYITAKNDKQANTYITDINKAVAGNTVSQNRLASLEALRDKVGAFRDRLIKSGVNIPALEALNSAFAKLKDTTDKLNKALKVKAYLEKHNMSHIASFLQKKQQGYDVGFTMNGASDFLEVIHYGLMKLYKATAPDKTITTKSAAGSSDSKTTQSNSKSNSSILSTVGGVIKGVVHKVAGFLMGVVSAIQKHLEAAKFIFEKALQFMFKKAYDKIRDSYKDAIYNDKRNTLNNAFRSNVASTFGYEGQSMAYDYKARTANIAMQKETMDMNYDLSKKSKHYKEIVQHTLEAVSLAVGTAAAVWFDGGAILEGIKGAIKAQDYAEQLTGFKNFQQAYIRAVDQYKQAIADLSNTMIKYAGAVYKNMSSLRDSYDAITGTDTYQKVAQVEAADYIKKYTNDLSKSGLANLLTNVMKASKGFVEGAVKDTKQLNTLLHSKVFDKYKLALAGLDSKFKQSIKILGDLVKAHDNANKSIMDYVVQLQMKIGEKGSISSAQEYTQAQFATDYRKYKSGEISASELLASAKKYESTLGVNDKMRKLLAKQLENVTTGNWTIQKYIEFARKQMTKWDTIGMPIIQPKDTVSIEVQTLEAIKDTKNFLEKILSGISFSLGGIGHILGNILGAIIDGVSAIVKAVGTLLSGIVELVSSLVKTIVGFVKDIVKGLTSLIKGVVSTVKNLIQEAIKGITNLIKGITNLIKGITSAIKNAAKSIVGSVGKAAKSIVSGLGKFFKNVGGGVVKAGGSIIGGVVHSVTHIFGGGGGFFAEGGFTGSGLGIRDKTGEIVAGTVHANEWVAPTWLIQQMPGLFAMLESVRKGNGSITKSPLIGIANNTNDTKQIPATILQTTIDLSETNLILQEQLMYQKKMWRILDHMDREGILCKS